MGNDIFVGEIHWERDDCRRVDSLELHGQWC